MALVKHGNHWHGDTQSDIRAELTRYSQINGYSADHFADSVCHCGLNQEDGRSRSQKRRGSFRVA
jgi:hypothetical protein